MGRNKAVERKLYFFMQNINKVVIKEEMLNDYDIIMEADLDYKYKQRLRCTYNDMKKYAKYNGYEECRQGNTTHKIWKNSDTGKSIPIPNKSGTIPQGTVSKILKQMETSRNELACFLYKH